jgi:hypothetical protein
VLANIVVGIAVSTASLALLDIFLSNSQKKWIENRSILLWNWLDDAKKLTFLEFANRHRRLVIGFSLFCVLSVKLIDTIFTVAGFMALGLPPVPYRLYWVGGLILGTLAFLLTVWAGVKAIAWILRGKTSGSQFRRLALFAPLAAPLVLLVGFWFSHYSLPPAVESVVILAAEITGLIPVFWLAVVLLMLLVYIGLATLYVGEFVVRRIAESDKGPILVVTAILTALAAFFKAGG